MILKEVSPKTVYLFPLEDLSVEYFIILFIFFVCVFFCSLDGRGLFGVSLTLCCFVVYSTRRLFYVLPCVILFLCFSVLLALRLPLLGKRELILVLFVRLFDLSLFGFVGFLFLLVSGKGCGL